MVFQLLDGHANDDGHEQNLQNIAFHDRMKRVGWHHINQHIQQRGKFTAACADQLISTTKIGRTTGGDHDRNHHGRDDRQQGIYQVYDKRFKPQPSDLGYIIEATNGMDDGDENQRNDQHFDHGHEHYARGVEKTADQKGLNDAGCGGEQLDG